jgi:DNA-binding transcriptional regulator YiaG
MANLASVFKAEIGRLSRKELREGSDALRKAVTGHRSEIASLKRRVQALEALVKKLSKGQGSGRNTATHQGEEEGPDRAPRFSAKGLAKNRERLGLSAADFGLLVGATGQSVYAWESGKTRPRSDALAAIAGLRKIGKRDVAAKLEGLRG